MGCKPTASPMRTFRYPLNFMAPDMAGKRRGPPGGEGDPRAEPSRAVPAASPRRSSSGGRAAAAQPPRGHAGAPEPPPPLLARASPPGPGLLGARRGREKGSARLGSAPGTPGSWDGAGRGGAASPGRAGPGTGWERRRGRDGPWGRGLRGRKEEAREAGRAGGSLVLPQVLTREAAAGSLQTPRCEVLLSAGVS